MAPMNQMQGNMGGNMGMSGMGQMSNIPPGGYPNNMMSGNMGSGVQSNNSNVGNNSTNGQGNAGAVSLSTTASDMSGANNMSHMSGGNMLNRMTTSSIGGMGGSMMNSSPYGQTTNPASMPARSQQTGDQAGYNQGGGVPSSSDKHVLSVLLNKPSARPQMNMGRHLRLPNSQVTVSDILHLI